MLTDSKYLQVDWSTGWIGLISDQSQPLSENDVFSVRWPAFWELHVQGICQCCQRSNLEIQWGINKSLFYVNIAL